MIDGMKGPPQALRPIRVQMCQFQQMLIVRRYLTQDPDLEASQELLNLINIITKINVLKRVVNGKELYQKNFLK